MRFNLHASVAALSLGLALLLSISTAGGEAHDRARPQHVESVPGELVVTVQGSRIDARSAVMSVEGASIKREAAAGSYALVSVPVGVENEYIERLSQRPGITHVERNTLKQPSFIPNDEFFPLQWHLPVIQAPSAWNVTMGEGVVVAVLDTGIAFEEWTAGGDEFVRAPDLELAQFVDPYNAVHGGSHANDDNGHGTHVTGTLAQSTNNGKGVAGVASDAQIMPVKVCVFIGCPSFAIADGILWAVDHGADIINMSLGGGTISDAERDALQYAEDNGVFVVAAAGNGGPDRIGDPFLDYPAAVDTVFSVGAIRYGMSKTVYSNYGAGDSVGLDVVAPGGDLTVDETGDGDPDGVLQNTFASLCGKGPFGDFTAFEYCYYQGTSMASPHVAGTAALLLSEYPDLTPPQLREVLRCSAKDVGEAGYDSFFGYGLVQAADALKDSDADGTVDCLDATPLALPPVVSIGSATVNSGDEVTVLLNANVDPPGLAAFAINVTFDPAVVQAVSCDVPAFAVCNLQYQQANIIRLSGAALDPIIGPTTLAEITFRAVASGLASTILNVDLDDFANNDLSDLVPDTVVQDGEIIVESPLHPASGDVNCDGVVDTLDLLAVLQHAAGTADPDCVYVGDVDCDGDVDTVDALKIAQFLAALPYQLPPGCPAIGSAG